MTESLDELREQIGRQEAEKWREISIQALRESGARLGWDVDEVAESFTEVEKRGEGWGFTVESDYASIMEFGTSPHTIRPDTAEVLSFEAGGEQVFAKEVEHPGTPALLFVQHGQNEIIVRGGR